MKTKDLLRLSLLFSIVLLFFSRASNAQTTIPFEDWVSTAGSQNFFYKNVTRTYGLDTYVAGATVNDSGNYDILLVKYGSSGAINWTVQYNGAGNGTDMAADLLVDANGVFLVGTTYKNGTNNQDAIIFKYNTSGTQQWVKTYNGTGSSYDGFTSLCTDGTYIYTSGGSFGSTANSDYIVNSYRISDGNQMWVSRYNSTYDLHDLPNKITYNPTFGITYRITVSGGMQYTSTNWKFGTVTYNTSGTMGAATLSGTNSDGLVRVTDITTDASGNTYVIGAIQNSGQYDWRTIKLNTSLTESWAVEYDGGSSLEDCPMAIKEKSGYLYITGFSTVTGQGRNIVTRKLSASTGATQWTQTYNGATNGDDEGGAIVLDGSTNVYVGGTTNNGSNSDFITTKYNSSGTQQWQMMYNSIANTNDKVYDIALSGASDVVVTGQSGIGTNLSYLTVKYVQRTLTVPPDPEPTNIAYSYVENRGQLINTSGSAIPGIKFYNKRYAPNLYVADTSITYVVAKVDGVTGTNDTLHRIDIKYAKRNTGEKIRPLTKKTDFINYYADNMRREMVPQYERLVYPSLFTNIDMYLSSNSNGHKLMFVCKPGFTLADLELEFTGQTGISINGSGDLVLANLVDTIIHPKATVYQINGGSYSSLGWQPSYSLTTNKIKFTSLGTYNTGWPLVFEINLGPNNPPSTTSNGNLDWSTMYGNSTGNDMNNDPYKEDFGDDYGMDVVASPINGNPYMAGKFNSVNLPIQVGQQVNGSFAGGVDGYIQAFYSNAIPKWLTWLGGSGEDVVNSLAIKDARVYATGKTNTGNLFNSLGQSGVYKDTIISGDFDGFVSSYDTTNGSIKWGTYFGGTGFDEARSIVVDPAGAIFIGGNTKSTTGTANSCQPPTNNNFPLCNPGGPAYYQSTNTGQQDIFLARFNTSNSLTWSTYYGSNANDYLYEIDKTDFLSVVGATEKASDTTVNYTNATGPISGNFPLCKPTGTPFFQASRPMGFDTTVAFFSEFTDSVNLIWATNFKYVKEFQTTRMSNTGRDMYFAGIANGTISSKIKCTPDYDSLHVCRNNVFAAIDTCIYEGTTMIGKFNKITHELEWTTYLCGTSDMDILQQYFDPNSNNPIRWAFPSDKFMDIQLDAQGSQYITTIARTPITLSTQSGSPGGMYLQSSISAGDNLLFDAAIAKYTAVNAKDWVSYFGDPNAGSTYVFDWPHGQDFGRALATYKNEALYLTGYAGRNVPLQDFNTSSTQDYFQTHNWTYEMDAFISRFNLKSIGVSIEEQPITIGKGILLYPNPAQTQLNIALDDIMQKDKITISIYDMSGKLILTNSVYNQPIVSLDINTFASGIYLIQVVGQNDVRNAKFIKQ